MWARLQHCTRPDLCHVSLPGRLGKQRTPDVPHGQLRAFAHLSVGRGSQLLVDFIKTRSRTISGSFLSSQVPRERTVRERETAGLGATRAGDTPAPRGRPDSVLASRLVRCKTELVRRRLLVPRDSGDASLPTEGPGRALATLQGAGVTRC